MATLLIPTDTSQATLGFLLADGTIVGSTSQAQDFGSNGIKTDKLVESTSGAGILIDGAADAVQLTVQAHSTQGNAVFVVEKSDGTNLLAIDNAGDGILTGNLAVLGSTGIQLAASGVRLIDSSGSLSLDGSLIINVSPGFISDSGGARFRMNQAGTMLLFDNNEATRVTISSSSPEVTLTGDANVTGALTATSYGGIAEANLLDKTATETVSGAYTHSADLTLTAALVTGNDGIEDRLGTTRISLTTAFAAIALTIQGAVSGNTLIVKDGNLQLESGASDLDIQNNKILTTNIQMDEGSVGGIVGMEFQPTSSNAQIALRTVPSGTATISFWEMYNSSTPATDKRVQFGLTSTTFSISTGDGTTSYPLDFVKGGNRVLFLDTSETRIVQDTMIGADASPSAVLHVDQTSTSGAKPVLHLDQADVDEDLISIVGTSVTTVADATLVEEAEVASPGALTGWMKVKVVDTRAGGIADGDYYIQLYAAPTMT